MERLDALVAGVGVLVVVTAMAGVVLSGPGEGAEVFTVGFPAMRDALPSAQAGIGRAASSATLDVDVDAANLTEVQLTVRVQGGQARVQAAGVAVQVTGPQGQTATPGNQQLPGPGSGGEVTFQVSVPIGEVPQAVPVQASSEEEALATVADRGTTAGAGTWEVVVTVTRGPASVETFTVVVEPVVVTYHAVVQPDVANPR